MAAREALRLLERELNEETSRIHNLEKQLKKSFERRKLIIDSIVSVSKTIVDASKLDALQSNGLFSAKRPMHASRIKISERRKTLRAKMKKYLDSKKDDKKEKDDFKIVFRKKMANQKQDTGDKLSMWPVVELEALPVSSSTSPILVKDIHNVRCTSDQSVDSTSNDISKMLSSDVSLREYVVEKPIHRPGFEPNNKSCRITALVKSECMFDDDDQSNEPNLEPSDAVINSANIEDCQKSTDDDPLSVMPNNDPTVPDSASIRKVLEYIVQTPEQFEIIPKVLKPKKVHSKSKSGSVTSKSRVNPYSRRKKDETYLGRAILYKERIRLKNLEAKGISTKNQSTIICYVCNEEYFNGENAWKACKVCYMHFASPKCYGYSVNKPYVCEDCV